MRTRDAALASAPAAPPSPTPAPAALPRRWPSQLEHRRPRHGAHGPRRRSRRSRSSMPTPTPQRKTRLACSGVGVGVASAVVIAKTSARGRRSWPRKRRYRRCSWSHTPSGRIPRRRWQGWAATRLPKRHFRQRRSRMSSASRRRRSCVRGMAPPLATGSEECPRPRTMAGIFDQEARQQARICSAERGGGAPPPSGAVFSRPGRPLTRSTCALWPVPGSGGTASFGIVATRSGRPSSRCASRSIAGPSAAASFVSPGVGSRRTNLTQVLWVHSGGANVDNSPTASATFAVPEPALLTLLAVALAGLGMALRLRRA
jgi:hypothetical protein